MDSITVLHLSDLHYSNGKHNDQQIIRDALLRDLRRVAEEESLSIDIVIFSGDLVQTGDDSQSFSAAHEFLVTPVLQCIGVGLDRYFIAPGNHDVERQKVRASRFIEDGLRNTLTNVDAINAFIDQFGSENNNDVALDRLLSFMAFQGSLPGTAVTATPFVRTYRPEISGTSIGIACFNTSWRATGEADDVDRGHLILGERAVDIAIRDLAGTALKLAVFHHPLHWLS